MIDEAQHATEEHLAAITPILFANANPQLNIAGTAGLEGKSEWWWSQRLRAMSPDPGAFAFMEHSAERVSVDPDGTVVQVADDPLDREVWRRNNPAIGCGRNPDGMEFLEEQLKTLGVEAFAQEHLCVWAPPGGDHREAKLPAAAWELTIGPAPKIEPGAVTITYDVDLDGEHSSIAIGAGSITDPYVEVIEHKAAAGWLPARLVELVGKWDPIAVGCNGAGPAGAQVGPVLAAFRGAGISADLLHQLNAVEYKQACGGFYTDVVEGRLVHPPDQGPLDRAAADAAERPLGDAWAWDRRSATVPISPLVAVTIARALLPVEVETPAPVFAY